MEAQVDQTYHGINENTAVTNDKSSTIHISIHCELMELNLSSCLLFQVHKIKMLCNIITRTICAEYLHCFKKHQRWEYTISSVTKNLNSKLILNPNPEKGTLWCTMKMSVLWKIAKTNGNLGILKLGTIGGDINKNFRHKNFLSEKSSEHFPTTYSLKKNVFFQTF